RGGRPGERGQCEIAGDRAFGHARARARRVLRIAKERREDAGVLRPWRISIETERAAEAQREPAKVGFARTFRLVLRENRARELRDDARGERRRSARERFRDPRIERETNGRARDGAREGAEGRARRCRLIDRARKPKRELERDAPVLLV